MSPRTKTAELTDKAMWRKLLRLAHPDAGGSDELFVWARELQDKVCSGQIGDGSARREEAATRQSYEPPPRSESRRDHRAGDGESPDRIPYSPYAFFNDLTKRALRVAEEQPFIYSRLLRLLWDCYETPAFEAAQQRGASYRQLAAIAHKVGMSKSERVQWYRVAESIPLSDRHAGHILGRLKR